MIQPPDSEDPNIGLVRNDEHSLMVLLQSILASVPDAMVVIDDSGRMLAFSAAAERLFGYDAKDMAGQNVSLLMTATDQSYHDRYINNYLTTGEKQIIGKGRIVEARLADGSVIPVELKIGEARLENRRLFTGYIRDVTGRQAAEHRIKQMQAELTSFSRLSAVGTMASAMAHELNQPLTAVANYLEAARDMLATPNAETIAMVHEALDAAAAQSIRAGQIIRRLRDYVSRGEIETRPVDLATLIHEAVSLAKIGVSGPLARIVERVPANLPLVMADRVQVRQVVVNLVKNAIEALHETDNPMIWIEAEAKPDQGDEVTIRVRDNGPGFDSGDGETPFQPFQSSKPTGMGLGLSICQTIIEAHGGVIGASSKPGEGATFTFTLKSTPPRDVV